MFSGRSLTSVSDEAKAQFEASWRDKVLSLEKKYQEKGD